MTDLTVANIILQQLGGSRFKAMTGAKNFLGDANSLMFSIPKSKGINKVRVTLLPSDTYKIEFMNFSMRKLECKTVAEVSEVYCDQLAYIFEEYTGLYTKF